MYSITKQQQQQQKNPFEYVEQVVDDFLMRWVLIDWKTILN